MKRVLIFGVFDLLHEGHKYFLKKSKEFGDFLIVSVARDTYVQQYKGRTPEHDENQRIAALEKSGLADQVILSDSDIGTFNVVEKTHPDVICLGYDQNKLKENLLAWIDAKALKIKVLTMPPFKEDTYKTTYLIDNKRQGS